MAACRVGIYKDGSFLQDEAASDCSRQPVARFKSRNIDLRGKSYEPRIPTKGKGLNIQRLPPAFSTNIALKITRLKRLMGSTLR